MEKKEKSLGEIVKDYEKDLQKEEDKMARDSKISIYVTVLLLVLLLCWMLF